MSSKQTAVEWLIDKINHTGWGNIMIDIPKEFIEQAKAIEKEQIKLAFGQGSLFDVVFPDQYHYRAEDYYQHQYGL